MAELIYDSTARIIARDGTSYRPVVMGEQQPDGGWHAWIEFHPTAGGTPVRTGRETSQVSRGALEYWATGLEATYYEGAFDRANPLVRA